MCGWGWWKKGGVGFMEGESGGERGTGGREEKV